MSLSDKEESPPELLMAFNYGHDYKTSQIFGECEQINTVLREGNTKLLELPLPHSTPFSISPLSEEACSISGLLAEWRGLVQLLPNNKRQMVP